MNLPETFGARASLRRAEERLSWDRAISGGTEQRAGKFTRKGGAVYSIAPIAAAAAVATLMSCGAVEDGSAPPWPPPSGLLSPGYTGEAAVPPSSCAALSPSGPHIGHAECEWRARIGDASRGYACCWLYYRTHPCGLWSCTAGCGGTHPAESLEDPCTWDGAGAPSADYAAPGGG